MRQSNARLQYLAPATSQDSGATWSAPFNVAPASGNYSMQYGGLFAVGVGVGDRIPQRTDDWPLDTRDQR